MGLGNLQLTVKEPFLRREEEGRAGAWQAILTEEEILLLMFFSLLCFSPVKGKNQIHMRHTSKPLKEL